MEEVEKKVFILINVKKVLSWTHRDAQSCVSQSWHRLRGMKGARGRVCGQLQRFKKKKKNGLKYAVYIKYSTVSVLLTVLVLLPKPNYDVVLMSHPSEAIMCSVPPLWIICCRFSVLLFILLPVCIFWGEFSST